MQNLSVHDNRAFLIHHLDATRALGAGAGGGAAPRELTEILGDGDERSPANARAPRARPAPSG